MSKFNEIICNWVCLPEQAQCDHFLQKTLSSLLFLSKNISHWLVFKLSLVPFCYIGYLYHFQQIAFFTINNNKMAHKHTQKGLKSFQPNQEGHAWQNHSAWYFCSHFGKWVTPLHVCVCGRAHYVRFYYVCQWFFFFSQ